MADADGDDASGKKGLWELMKSRNPTRAEREWMDAIVQHGCVVCKKQYGVFTEPEVHHIDGKTKTGAHLKTIPLCYRHHREGVDTDVYTSRHPYKKRFEERYGTEQEQLEDLQRELGFCFT